LRVVGALKKWAREAAEAEGCIQGEWVLVPKVDLDQDDGGNTGSWCAVGGTVGANLRGGTENIFISLKEGQGLKETWLPLSAHWG